MKTKTIIVASLLSALTLPVFAQTGAAAAPAAPAKGQGGTSRQAQEAGKESGRQDREEGRCRH